MPINRYNQRTFHRTLFAGQLETVTLRKRGDDQQQGTLTSYVLYDCRWSIITKTGETLSGDVNSEHWRTCHIPRIEMERIGILYLNPDDKIIDQDGRVWNIERLPARTRFVNRKPQTIRSKLLELHYDVDCLRVKD